MNTKSSLFVLAAAISIGASAVAAETPVVCSHVAQLANHGQLAAALTESVPDLEEEEERPAVLDYEDTYYALDRVGSVPRYLRGPGADATLRLCEFEQRDGFVFSLTPYERLVRLAAGNDIWETAFTMAGTESAELLLAHGHQVPQAIEFVPPLTWAIVHKRTEASEWLLKHGASVNADRPSDMPLVRAVWIGDAATAKRLLEHGADPLSLVNQIRAMNELSAEQQRMLIATAVRRLGWIPESVVRHAVNRNPPLLDDLARSKLKVQLETRNWHEGRPVRLPYPTSSDLKKIDRIYKAGTLPPKEPIGVLSYGTFKRGVRLKREHDRQLKDDEVLTFATALCIHFFDAKCGPLQLQREARAWVKQLRYECPKDAKDLLSPAACKVMMHYANSDNPPLHRGLTIDQANGRMLNTWAAPIPQMQAELKRMYLEKRAQRTRP